MGNRKITLSGEELKRYMIEHSLDIKNKRKLSVREFLDTQDVGFSDSPGSWYYYQNKTKKFPPYPGEKVNDELIWKYAIDKGYFNSYEIPLEQFKNQWNKKTRTNYDEKVLRAVVEHLGEHWNKGVFGRESFKEYLRIMYGEDEIEKLIRKYQKELGVGGG